jgi:hypothetical protein
MLTYPIIFIYLPTQTPINKNNTSPPLFSTHSSFSITKISLYSPSLTSTTTVSISPTYLVLTFYFTLPINSFFSTFSYKFLKRFITLRLNQIFIHYFFVSIGLAFRFILIIGNFVSFHFHVI